MKHNIFGRMFWAILWFSILFVSGRISNAQVEIPDANLRTKIEAALGKNSGEPITPEEMKTLTRLEAHKANITDLTGLEHATGLEVLQLYDNQISDISPLSNLMKLRQLDIHTNQIEDISFLSNLVKLQILTLAVNRISDISPLSNLTDLGWLWLHYNQISDISALSNLSLGELNLSGNPVTDVSDLSNMTKLWWLFLDRTLVSDISALSELTNLTRLSLANTSISDISVLSNLINLRILHLHDCPKLLDISDLSKLTNLEELFLVRTPIQDISALANLTKLKDLRFGSSQVMDISVVSNLVNLSFLEIYYLPISDIFPIVENLGLGTEDKVDLRGNVLNYPSIHEYIPTLKERGVEIIFDNYRNPKFLRKVSDEPLIVEVRDENGAAFEGVPVNFAIVEGSGVIKETVATDKKGKAQAIFECNSSTGLNTISASVEGIEAPLSFNIVNEIGFDLTLPAGVSFIHIPLNITEVNEVATTIETLSDLYDLLGGESAVSVLITYDSTIQRWASYTGARDKGKPSDRVLTDDLGIIAGMNHPASLRLRGTPLGTNGQSSVMLCPGINLIGIPLKDSRITYISDILKLEGIAGNVSTVIVDDDGRTKIVAQLNDEGDRRVQGGQSFILVAQKSVTVDFEGWGWSSGIEKGLEFLDELLSN